MWLLFHNNFSTWYVFIFLSLKTLVGNVTGYKHQFTLLNYQPVHVKILRLFDTKLQYLKRNQNFAIKKSTPILKNREAEDQFNIKISSFQMRQINCSSFIVDIVFIVYLVDSHFFCCSRIFFQRHLLTDSTLGLQYSPLLISWKNKLYDEINNISFLF